jgi:hypothetical protein
VFERYSYRARCLVFTALWSARRRGGLYIEPEDLLHALIREDRGELASIYGEVFPGAAASAEFSAGDRRPFFPDTVARTLLRALHEDPDPLRRDTQDEKREPVPHVDMPVSRSLKEVFALVATAHRNDRKDIEPLDLLAGIAENVDYPLAQLLRDCGITRQSLANALVSCRITPDASYG